MAFRYGPSSYFRLGRVVPRERLRESYFREPSDSRFGGIFIPPPPPFFQRTACPPPPARTESGDSRFRRVEAADTRPRRVDEAESRPSRRDECR